MNAPIPARPGAPVAPAWPCRLGISRCLASAAICSARYENLSSTLLSTQPALESKRMSTGTSFLAEPSEVHLLCAVDTLHDLLKAGGGKWLIWRRAEHALQGRIGVLSLVIQSRNNDAVLDVGYQVVQQFEIEHRLQAHECLAHVAGNGFVDQGLLGGKMMRRE